MGTGQRQWGRGSWWNRFALAQYRGRYVVVNFFATWCVPCQQEQPELTRFAQQHSAAGDAQIVSVVYQDSPRRCANHVCQERQRVAGDRRLEGEGRLRCAACRSRFSSIPQGIVLARITGGVTEAGLDRLLAQAERAELDDAALAAVVGVRGRAHCRADRRDRRAARRSIGGWPGAAHHVRSPLPDLFGPVGQRLGLGPSQAIRDEVRRRVIVGQGDGEIRAFLVSRYGKDILLRPEAHGISALVWELPVAAFVVAIAGLVVAFRRWRVRTGVVVTPEDRALVEQALS